MNWHKFDAVCVNSFVPVHLHSKTPHAMGFFIDKHFSTTCALFSSSSFFVSDQDANVNILSHFRYHFQSHFYSSVYLYLFLKS